VSELRSAVIGVIGILICCAVAAAAFVPERSSAAPHAAIIIDDAESFTFDNGVISGSGTPSDPYILDGWTIEGNGSSVGILIQSTTEYLVIQNVRVLNCSIGISLLYVSNVRVSECTITENDKGVSIIYSSDCSVTENVITRNDCGICVYESSNYVVSPNTYIDNAVDVSLPYALASPIIWLTVAVLAVADMCIALWAWMRAPRRYRRAAQTGARILGIVVIQMFMMLYVINYLVVPAERGDLREHWSILGTYVVVGLSVAGTSLVALWGTRLTEPELR
jgi:parallel beta-helix repeat protein